MRRFSRRLAKIIGYSFLYVIITIAAAVGSLYLLSLSPTKESLGDKVEVAPQIDKIYKNLSSKDALHLDLELATSGDVNIALKISGDVKLNDPDDKFQLQGNIDLTINEETMPIDFLFKGGNLYLEMCSGRFSCNTTNLASTLDQVLTSLGVSLSSDELNLQDLDVETILGMLSDLEETVEKDAIILDINVPVVGSMQVVCDLNYNIKSLSIPQATIDGTTIEVDLNMGYPKNVEVEQPQELYLDVTSMFDVLSSTLNYLTTDKFGMGIEFKKDDFVFNGNLYASLRDLSATYEMDLLGQNAKMLVLDKVLYIELGNLNFKFDLNSLPDALEILNSHFNLNLPIDLIKDILATPKEDFLNLNFLQLLTNDDSSTLSNLDLSIIENFTTNGNVSTLTLKNIGNFDFVINDGNFESLTADVGNISVVATAIPAKIIKPSMPLDNYLDLAETLPIIDAAISMSEEDYIMAKGEIAIGGTSGEISLAADLVDTRIKLNLSAFGKEISLDYLSGNAYLTLDGINLCGTKEEIISLLEKFGLKFETNSIIETLKNWLDPQKNENLLSITSDTNSLTITLFDDKTITLYYDKLITKIDVDVGVAQISLSLSYPSKITLDPINEEDYSPASIVLDKIAKTYDYIKNKTYYLEIAGNTPLNTIKGFVNYEKGKVKANIEIASDSNFFGMIIEDGTIYLHVNDSFVSFPSRDLDMALKILQNSITADLSNIAINLDLNSIIENILNSVVLKIEQNNITFAFKDLQLNAGFINDDLNSLQIDGLDFTINLSVKDAAQPMPQFNKENYTSITTLTEKATALNEYIKCDKHFLTLNAQYKDITINGVLNHQNQTLSALLQVFINNTTASVTLQNNAIFIDYKDLHVSCNYSDIEQLVKLFNENLSSDLNELIIYIVNSITFDSTLIDKILSNSTLTFTDDNLTFGFDNALVEINFNNSAISSARINISDAEISLSVNNSPAVINGVNEENYIPLSTLMGKIKSVLTLINNKQLYLKFTANYSSIELNGQLNIDKTGLSLIANAQIDDVQLNLKLVGNTIYIEKDNLKLQFGFDEIESVKQFLIEEFNIDLSSILTESLAKFNLADLLENITLKFENNALKFEYGDFIGKVNFSGNDLSQIDVNYKDISVKCNVVSTKEEVEVKGKYTKIGELLPFVKALKDYISSNQYNITANANVYEKDTQIYTAQDMLFQLDLTGKISFYANASISGVKNTKTADFDLNLRAGGDKENIYVDYNNLKLKLSQNDFEKLVEMALKLFKMDSLVSTAKNVLNGQNISIDEIIKLITENSGNISLSSINLLERIDVENNVLKIILDGNTLSSSAKATQMEVLLITKNGRLSQISFRNFYTGATSNEHFDLDVFLHEFTGITSPDKSKSYIDLSGSSNLFEAALNTMSSYQTLELKGWINIKLKVGIIDIDWDIAVNIQLKVVDGKIEMQAGIGAIPVINLLVYNLNNDTPWSPTAIKPLSIKDRMLYIYYRDNYFYFYRNEHNSDGDSYQKALKAHYESVFNDILYYVQWGTGFNYDIINSIRNSVASDYTPNLGDIINSFSCPSQDNDYYMLNLNLNALTGNDKMGDFAVGASVKNVDGKNIIGGLSLDMDMPLISGTTLYLKSKSLTLTPGINIDMTTFNQYVDFLSKAKESVEYSALNKQWKQDTEKLFTIKFDTGFDDIIQPNVAGTQNTRFILPKYSNKIIGTKHEGIDYTVYSFVGWYTNKNFADESKFTKGIIPAKNITLYGKWIIKEGYRTINYYNNGNLIASDYALIGSPLRRDIAKSYIEVEQNNTLCRQEFVGWKDKNGVTVEIVPEESENLYANYQTYQTLNKYTLSVVQGVGGQTLDLQIFETLELKNYLPSYSKISVRQDNKISTYSFKGWFTDGEYSTPAPTTMPSHNLTIYAKWELDYTSEKIYKLTIYDNDKEYSGYYEANKPVLFSNDMPIYSTTRWYYDSNYILPTSRPILMPEHDVTLYIRNKYNVSYTYYVLENGRFTTKTFSSDLYQGTQLNLPKLVDFEETVKENNVPSKRIGYHFHDYKTPNGETVNSGVVPNHDLTFSATYTSESKPYFKLTFHSEWVEPGWWVSSSGDTASLSDMYVLEGSYIIGTTLYNVVDLSGNISTESLQIELSRTYIGVDYDFNIAAWNTTKCKNLYTSAFGNVGASKDTIEIHSNTDLYAEWRHD